MQCTLFVQYLISFLATDYAAKYKIRIKIMKKPPKSFKPSWGLFFLFAIFFKTQHFLEFVGKQ